ncbi:DUF5667 domain-containing protein [Actinomycetospora sp. TBRC 11914]|uniref:DUF5667 domain-containing protein n=1 Tax=Actinomycetospora sp. TBRC 11914 TaxID=2729387 RepID=UPI00145C94E7|nr:DUF5667 domain-containing protein [Actinomycetospora sp. TBRC 11914]NMO91849.1 hypothetical protein [Actinomycetospora sp. TBRC 11914]
MSSGRDGADERFAAAWDERMRGRAAGRRAHPGASGAPLGDHDRTGDRELDADLRIADLLTRAGEAGRAGSGPDPEASRRMRASLMAALAEEAPPQVPVTRRTERVEAGAAGHGRRRADRRGDARPGDRRPGTTTRTPSAGPGRSARRGTTARRLLSTTVAGMAAVLALGALTVLLSRGALPGDMLYGLKRASESTEIGLTSGQEAKARKHLDVAALRLDEIQELIQRDSTTAAGSQPTAAGADDADAALVADNLRAFDDQARTGARMLLPLVNKPAGPPPGLLSQWATQQAQTLNGFSASLPDGGKQQAASSQRLISQLRERAAAFEKSTSTPCGGSDSDDLGPLPSAACSAAANQDRAPSLALPQTSTSATKTSTPATRRATSSSETTTTTTDESTTSKSSGDGNDKPLLPLPLSPTTTAPPINVPVPVPGLPKVQLPPLLPGLPGLSLGN